MALDKIIQFRDAWIKTPLIIKFSVVWVYVLVCASISDDLTIPLQAIVVIGFLLDALICQRVKDLETNYDGWKERHLVALQSAATIYYRYSVKKAMAADPHSQKWTINLSNIGDFVADDDQDQFLTLLTHLLYREGIDAQVEPFIQGTYAWLKLKNPVHAG